MINSIKRALKQSGLARYIVSRYRARARLPHASDLLVDGFSAVPVQAEASEILFATSAGGNLPAVALETILAIALRMRKANVTVLLCDGVLPACLLCTMDGYRNERKFAARGPSAWHCNDCFSLAQPLYATLGVRIVRYSSLVERADRDSVDAIERSLSVEQIKSYEDEGIAVGEHALAGALRFYARATLDDQYAETVLRRYFRASLLVARAMRRLVRGTKFDCAVFDHGIYVPNGIIGEVARHEGLRVVNWHVAYRKRCFIFSHRETYHHTLMDEPTASWENMPWTQEMETQILDYLRSRWSGGNDWITFNRNSSATPAAIANEVGIDLTKTTIGMLTNVMWDAQLHYPANAFANMLEWVLATIGYFAKRGDLQLLIRVHPAEITGTLPSRQSVVQEIAKAFPRLPSNVFVVPPTSTLSTYQLMRHCNAAIIYGTKMGVELTSMGMPTIVAGEAWIRNKGITMDARTKADYIQLLDSLPAREAMRPDIVQRARKYAYHFFFRRMIPLNCVEAIQATPPFKASFTSLKSLSPGADAGLDVICDGIMHGTDFVYHAEKLQGDNAVRRLNQFVA